MTKVAVVILNWNGKALLERYLPSVVAHSTLPDVQIVVADNGSTDNSIAFVTSHFPNVTVVALKENLGFAEGYNSALAQLDAEYFVLLNSDVEPHTDWLAPMITFMDNNMDVAVCGPKILDHKNKTLFEYAGGSGGFVDKYGYPFCRGRVFSTIEPDLGQYNNPKDVVWVSGCCLMIRSNEYHNIGGLDSRFFAHQEEVDLCWRLINQGKRVVVVPQSTVFHLGGASLSAEHPQKTFLNFRNSLLLIYKNLPVNQFPKSYRARLVLDLLAAVKILVSNGFSHSTAIFKAHIEFAKMRGFYKQYRIENRTNTNSISPLILSDSLVFRYYIKKQQKFSDISKQA